MVLASDHVGHPHQMVVYGHGQIHHGICDVLRPGPRVRVSDQSQGYEIPYRRVRMVYRGLDDRDGLPIPVFSCQESLEPLQVLLHGKVAARTGPHLLLHTAPLVRVAGAHVPVPHPDKLLRYVVIMLESLGLHDVLVDAHPQPFQVLSYHIIGFRLYLIRIRVLESAYQLPAVSFDVLVIQYPDAGVPDMQGPGRPRGDPHHHFPFYVLQIRQSVGLLLLLSDEHVGIYAVKLLRLSVGAHGIDLCHDPLRGLLQLTGPLSVFRAFAQDLAGHGFWVRLSFVEYCILQRVLPDHGVHHLVGHDHRNRIVLYQFSRLMPGYI